MASPRTWRPLCSALRGASSRSAVLHAQKHAYHAYDYAPPPPFAPAESAILACAYAHVAAHGFTMDALKRGARDAGYLEASTNLLPRGVFDLVNYHLVTQRLALQHSMPCAEESTSEQKMGVGSKVQALTLARLRANAPILHRWPEVGGGGDVG